MKWVRDTREYDHVSLGRAGSGVYIATVKERRVGSWNATVEVRTEGMIYTANNTHPALDSAGLAQAWCAAALKALMAVDKQLGDAP